MGHPRRMYSAGTVYFVTNRVAEGLPFVANGYIRRMLFGVLARASCRYSGITICAWLFMGNHYHAIVVLRGEPSEFSEFMNFVNGEIAKLVVRWLGKRNVRVWAQRYHAAALLTSEDVFEKMVYLFLNPVRARLVARAEDWKGASTFFALRSSERRWFKRIRPSQAIRFKDGPTSPVLLQRLIFELNATDAPEYELRVSPFAWMDCFSSTKRASCKILLARLIERLNTEAEEVGRLKGCPVVGAKVLATANPHQRYLPRKRGRRMPCLSENGELRRRFVILYRTFCRRARKAWKDARLLNAPLRLPPGAFFPPRPFRCCLLAAPSL